MDIKSIIAAFFNRPSYRKSGKLTVRPSVISLPCLRKAFYNYHQVEMDFEPNLASKKIMMLGNKIHEMVTEWLKSSDNFISYSEKDHEFPVEGEIASLKVKGKIDGILIINDYIWILEIKSINNFAFNALKRPKEEHLSQAALYLHLFEKNQLEGKYDEIDSIKNKQIGGIVFIYVNKNDVNIKLFDINIISCKKALQIIISRIEWLRNHIQNFTLPDKTKYYCEGCEYRLKCKGEFNPIAR